MKGSRLDPSRGAPVWHFPPEAFLQLPGCLVRKGDCCDLRRLYAAELCETADPGGQGPGLSCSRPRDHSHGMGRVLRCPALPLIKAGQKIRLQDISIHPLCPGPDTGVTDLSRQLLPARKRADVSRQLLRDSSRTGAALHGFGAPGRAAVSLLLLQVSGGTGLSPGFLPAIGSPGLSSPGSKDPGHGHLSIGIFQLVRPEQPDRSVLPVKAWKPRDLPVPETPDPFRRQMSKTAADVLYWHFPEDLKFRSQLPEHIQIFLLYPFAGRRPPCGSGDHLRQRDQALKGLSSLRQEALRPVGQLADPVGNAHGHPLFAYRTDPSMALRLQRTHADMAFPVAVKMVLSLLGKKLDGAGQSVPRFHRSLKPRIGQLCIQQVRFSSQLCRRVGVGIGNKLETVQSRKPPVHGRIRRKPCLHRVDMGSQIPEALLHRIEAGTGSEHGKMRRPDMGRNKNAVRTGFQHDLQEITAGKPQDRPPV